MPTISTDQAHRGSDQMMMGGGTSAPVCWNFDMFDKNENCGISLCAKRAGDTNVTMRLK